jgi:C1A family cysteine protease
VLAKYGVCPEALWPYEDERLIRKPADDCYIQALGFRAIAYRRVRSLYELKHALASGLPVAIGIAVYESFESAMVAKTGDVPMPNRGWVCRESLLGWHAVTAVGYNDLERKIICRNSWGASWGRAGHFFLSYEYILDPSLSGDFWTCTQTSLDAVAMNADPESEEPINV